MPDNKSTKKLCATNIVIVIEKNGIFGLNSSIRFELIIMTNARKKIFFFVPVPTLKTIMAYSVKSWKNLAFF
jgi:hypothetical protein